MATNVSFTIDLDGPDELRLRSALGDPQDFEGALARHAKAAAWEYLELYLGRRVLSRGSDILEQRLRLLSEHAFEGRIPSDAQVSQLFQVTPSASRTLVRNVLSKYRYDLDPAVAVTAQAVLEGAQSVEAGFQLEVGSAGLLEFLNSKLQPIDQPVARIAGTGATYLATDLSYGRLCAALGAKPVPK